MERVASFNVGVASSSASQSSASSNAPSRRNSFTLLEKPADSPSALSSFSSFVSLNGMSSSRVALLPVPVVSSAASSAMDIAKSSLKWLPTSRITIPSSAPIAIFPSSKSPDPMRRIVSVLGHCFYRRVIVWTAAILSILIVAGIVGHHQHPEKFRFSGKRPLALEPTGPSAESIWLNYTALDGYFNGIQTIVPIGQYRSEYPTAVDQEMARLEQENEAANRTGTAPAVQGGDVQKRSEVRSSSATVTTTTSAAAATTSAPLHTPTVYNAHPEYNSSAYLSEYYPVHRCYLDADHKVPAPSLYAFSGVPQGQPEPLIGSHSLLGIRDNVCFDRFGRYGPYGLGYSRAEGGTGQGIDTEDSGKELVWAATGRINYDNMDWGAAQKRCFEANKDRFVSASDKESAATEYPRLTDELRMKKIDGRATGTAAATADATGVAATVSASSSAATPTSDSKKLKKIERQAIVIRCYAGFKWTPHAVLNFRALVNELSLQSGGEYDVHILLHARDENVPIWADAETASQFIEQNIPAEFRSLATLWSEGQMRLLYPTMRGQPGFHNPANQDIHGVYRSPHLPLQHFAQQHPEYAHFWNWEMDMRFLGSYYEFFDRLGKWGDAQKRRRIWDRAAKYYIPALHGSWENFTALVDAEAHEAGRPSILGQMYFAGRTATRDEERGISPLPATGCEGAVLSEYNRTEPLHNATSNQPGRHFFNDRNNNYTNIPEQCGVGEAADLITLNPIFDAEDSGWFFANDVTGYDLAFAIPPRRTAIITASRLSRRLLFAMHEETWRLHHGMFAEMFPPSVALHRGFKAVYAPHPVYADRRWPLNAAERAFNAGPDHSSGASPQSPFEPGNEHYHRGLTWYYNADFAGRLWRRWLGYPQPTDDPKQPKPTYPNGTEIEQNPLETLGGGWGQEQRGTGRMCMRSVLVHPIKYENLEEVIHG